MSVPATTRLPTWQWEAGCSGEGGSWATHLISRISSPQGPNSQQPCTSRTDPARDDFKLKVTTTPWVSKQEAQCKYAKPVSD